MSAPRQLTVTVASAAKRLASLAVLKEELGITGSGEDARLVRLLDRASERIASEQFLGYPPWRQTYSARLAGSGRQRLYPGVAPIESVSVVTRNGSTIESDTYDIRGTLREYLFKKTLWPRDFGRHPDPTADEAPGYASPEYELTLIAGWLGPDAVSDWAESTAYAAGAFVRASSGTAVPRFEATTAGTSGGSEPTWPVAAGGTVTDGSVVWTARAALELPAALTEAAIALARGAYHAQGWNPMISTVQQAGRSVTFRGGAGVLDPQRASAAEAQRLVAPYRVLV